MLKNSKTKFRVNGLLAIVLLLLLAGAAVYYYFSTLTHADTATLNADFTVEAIPFINEFEKDLKTANKKYAEKIIAVTGKVTAVLPADTTFTVEMKNPATGSYLIFDFQQKDQGLATKLKTGDSITIKGSCSDGVYSDILGTYFISFKRCTIVSK